MKHKTLIIHLCVVLSAFVIIFVAGCGGGSSQEATPTAQLVKDIVPGQTSSNPNFLTNVNGTLFFVADDGLSGAELWKSGGTAIGTVRVKDINPGAAGSNPNGLTDVA